MPRVSIGMDSKIASIAHHRRIFISVLIALAFLEVIFATSSQVAFAASETRAATGHIITLHDNGEDIGFKTKKSTLREALKERKIRLDPLDRTEPGLDEKLVANSYQVNVYRARPVVIRDGGSEVKVITSYRTAKQIAAQAHITLYDEDIAKVEPSRDPIADGVAEVLTISRSTPFAFNFYGKEQTARTMAHTVGDMLKEKGIKMEPIDGISPSVDTPITATMTVKLWRNGVQTLTQEEDVKFDTKKVEDADQPVGYKKVTTTGVNGKRTVTYEVNMQNGVEVSRKEINSVTTKQPVQQVETVGAKPVFTGDFAAALAQLRKCESGGNYANTRNPKYRGAYQYDYSTWANYQGYYDPADAPPAVQDQKAWETYQRRGWQPWPHCGAGLPDTYR